MSNKGKLKSDLGKTTSSFKKPVKEVKEGKAARGTYYLTIVLVILTLLIVWLEFKHEDIPESDNKNIKNERITNVLNTKLNWENIPKYKESDSVFRIVILPLNEKRNTGTPGAFSQSATSDICKKLQKMNTDDTLNIYIEPIPSFYITHYFNEDSAKILIDSINCDMLLWGDFYVNNLQIDTDDSIEINYRLNKKWNDVLDVRNSISENPQKQRYPYENNGKLLGNVDYVINMVAAINCRKQGKLQKCLHYLNYIQNDLGILTDHLFEQGAAVFASVRDYQKAIICYSFAIELNPVNFYAYGERGALYLGLGIFDSCISDCLKSLSIKDNDNITFNNLGMAYLNKNNLEMAKKYLFKSVSIKEDVYPNINLSLCYYAQSKIDSAMIYAYTAVNIQNDEYDKDHLIALRNLSDLQILLDSQDAALKTAGIMLERDSEFYSSHFIIAKYYYLKGNKEIVKQESEKALILYRKEFGNVYSRELFEIVNLRVVFEIENNDFQRAEQDLNEIIKAGDESWESRYHLIICSYALGKYKQCIDLANSAILISKMPKKKMAEILRLSGLSKIETGSTIEGCNDLRSAILNGSIQAYDDLNEHCQ
jgi:tetratricopeptide (TPR) repeat protein